MANFSVPTVNDTQGFFEIFTWVNNTATDGLFFPIMLLTIWIIAFIGTITQTKKVSVAWTFSSFIGSILAILLSLMGFLSPNYIYLLVFGVASGILWTHLIKNKLT